MFFFFFFFLRRLTTFRTQKKPPQKSSLSLFLLSLSLSLSLSLFLSSLGLWLCKRKTAEPKVCRHVNFELWPYRASDTSKNLRTGPSDFRRRSQDTESVGDLDRCCSEQKPSYGGHKLAIIQMGPCSAKIVVWHLVRPFVRLACADHRLRYYSLILRRINFFLRVLVKIKFIPRTSVCHKHLEAFLSTRNVWTCRAVLTGT